MPPQFLNEKPPANFQIKYDEPNLTVQRLWHGKDTYLSLLVAVFWNVCVWGMFFGLRYSKEPDILHFAISFFISVNVIYRVLTKLLNITTITLLPDKMIVCYGPLRFGRYSKKMIFRWEDITDIFVADKSQHLVLYIRRDYRVVTLPDQPFDIEQLVYQKYLIQSYYESNVVQSEKPILFPRG